MSLDIIMCAVEAKLSQVEKHQIKGISGWIFSYKDNAALNSFPGKFHQILKYSFIQALIKNWKREISIIESNFDTKTNRDTMGKEKSQIITSYEGRWKNPEQNYLQVKWNGL